MRNIQPVSSISRKCSIIARHHRNHIPLENGVKGVTKKLAKTCPHETRPRKNGEWGGVGGVTH